MKVYIDLDTHQVVSNQTSNQQLNATSLIFKRGDTTYVDVYFVQEGVVQELGAGFDGSCALKATDGLNSGFLAHVSGWTKNGTGEGTFYRFELNTNTNQLNDFMGHNNPHVEQKSSAVVAFEVNWGESSNSTEFSTLAQNSYVENDVIKGNEATVDATPAYPSSTDVQQAIDDVADLQARRDAEPHDNTATYEAGELVFFDNKVHRALEAIAAGENPTTDPSKWLEVGGAVAGIITVADVVFAPAATGEIDLATLLAAHDLTKVGAEITFRAHIPSSTGDGRETGFNLQLTNSGGLAVAQCIGTDYGAIGFDVNTNSFEKEIFVKLHIPAGGLNSGGVPADRLIMAGDNYFHGYGGTGFTGTGTSSERFDSYNKGVAETYTTPTADVKKLKFVGNGAGGETQDINISDILLRPLN